VAMNHKLGSLVLLPCRDANESNSEFFFSYESHGDGIRQAALIVVDSHICLAVLDFICPLNCVSLTHSVA
jgi:hypothetical protein